MNENPTASDWASARGEKWCAQLASLEAMMTPIDPPLISALRLDQPYRVADIGCGGGGTTLEIRDHAPAGSVVHGFDISPASISVACTHVKPEQQDVLSFAVADVSTARPPGGPYDRLASRFGTMFFADPSSAFANLCRWLKPGGRFAFAVWGDPKDNPWVGVVRQTVAELVDLPQIDRDAPGPFRYADPGKLPPLLETAGFIDIGIEDWRGEIPVGGGKSAAEAAAFALDAFSNFKELLAERSDGAFDRARRALAERLEPFEIDSHVQMGARVLIFHGGTKADSMARS